MFKILALAAITVWAAVLTLPDNKLHAVVCDVGQGDGILIYRGTWQMVIDGGPDDKILTCLSDHMPFYDRKIEIVMATHPQADHITGLISIAKRYSVEYFVSGQEGNETQGYRDLVEEIKKHTESKLINVYTGDKIKVGKVEFRVVWPERSWVMAHVVGDIRVLGAKTDGTDLNGFGISGILSYGNFDVMLTADADAKIEPAEMGTGLLRRVDVLKVPHHGSKTGMTKEWLDVVRPQLAVVSVGGKNRYGHPTKEAIDMLSSVGAKIMRTDEDGSVEIVSDGIKWWIKK